MSQDPQEAFVTLYSSFLVTDGLGITHPARAEGPPSDILAYGSGRAHLPLFDRKARTSSA